MNPVTASPHPVRSVLFLCSSFTSARGSYIETSLPGLIYRLLVKFVMTANDWIVTLQPPEEPDGSASAKSGKTDLSHGAGRIIASVPFYATVRPPLWLCLRIFGWMLPPDWCNTSGVLEFLRHRAHFMLCFNSP
jgi:hypothetical protein